ncbi:MAG: APC family permease [Planctomycetota bacterium]
MDRPSDNRSLRCGLGVWGAVGLGLGSMLGTGVFVSLGLGAAAAGGWVLVVLVLAGLLATANALSSAQLAAVHPTSGGTYEYGYRELHPAAGFAAGWMFLCAKSASAATAALGFAAYTLGDATPGVRTGVAVAAVIVVSALVFAGIKRSAAVNAAIVAIVVGSLVVLLVIVGARQDRVADNVGVELGAWPGVGLAEATALMFVAYTGYGRIATLGEEVYEPAKTIPRAIVVTMIVTGVLYVAVAVAVLAVLGAEGLAANAGSVPLLRVAEVLDAAWLAWVVLAGACAAMLGVLLNLVLGLSRMVLAMGRRGDLPSVCAQIDARSAEPRVAVVGVGALVALLAGLGSIELAWTFSAFTVLMYYAVTNAASLRLRAQQRLYPRWVSWAGLIGCLSIGWTLEPKVWLAGLAVLAIGFVLRAIGRRVPS